MDNTPQTRHRPAQGHLTDDDTEASLDWLLDMLAAAVSRFDPFAVVIDPWNALEHKRPAGMTTTEYVGVSIERLRRFARKRRIHIAVVAHPAKLQATAMASIPSRTYGTSAAAPTGRTRRILA